MSLPDIIDQVRVAAAGFPIVRTGAWMHTACLLIVGGRPFRGRALGLFATLLLVAFGWLTGITDFYWYLLVAGAYLWLIVTRYTETRRRIPTPRQIRRAGGCAGCCLHPHVTPAVVASYRARSRPTPPLPPYAVASHREDARR